MKIIQYKCKKSIEIVNQTMFYLNSMLIFSADIGDNDRESMNYMPADRSRPMVEIIQQGCQ